jgi:hypothetical protein
MAVKVVATYSAMASQEMGMSAGNSDERLLSILASLEECRAALRQAGKADTAQLVAVAVLDLRMKLHRIDDAELKALCEEMTLPEPSEQRPRDGRSQRRRPLLRIVK